MNILFINNMFVYIPSTLTLFLPYKFTVVSNMAGDCLKRLMTKSDL